MIKSGDVEAVFRSVDPSCIVEGDVKIGGQEHFYLETHAAIAVPSKEDDELQIISSTQHPTEIQVNCFCGDHGINCSKVMLVHMDFVWSPSRPHQPHRSHYSTLQHICWDFLIIWSPVKRRDWEEVLVGKNQEDL